MISAMNIGHIFAWVSWGGVRRIPQMIANSFDQQSTMLSYLHISLISGDSNGTWLPHNLHLSESSHA